MTDVKKYYLSLLERQFRLKPETAFIVEGLEDLRERGWGEINCAFQIVWEDGPYDWAIAIFDNLPGYFAEAYNGFVLTVYDESVDYPPLNVPEPAPAGLAEVAAKAQKAWDEAIASLPDEGTCTGGKGLVLAGTMNYRNSVQNLVVRANCQGNIPAQKTKDIPMKIMADAGFPCEYYDGWMD